MTTKMLLFLIGLTQQIIGQRNWALLEEAILLNLKLYAWCKRWNRSRNRMDWIRASWSKVGGVKEYDNLFNNMLPGNSYVGKSCMLVRFTDDDLSQTKWTDLSRFLVQVLVFARSQDQTQNLDTAVQDRDITRTNAYYIKRQRKEKKNSCCSALKVDLT
jgi:hypothetical protein